MSIVVRHRGRNITESDVEQISALIAAHPESSRRQLSVRLCEAWDWRQANGALRDMVCRSLMLALHRAGHITLPPVRQRPRNNALAHRRAPTLEVDRRPVRGRLSDLDPVEIRPVRRTPDEGLFDSLLAAHHYLGYTRPVGEQMKYLVWAQGRPLGCLGFGSAPRHLGPRDRFIGWSAAVRRAHLQLLAYNTRFLILPWVEVPHLASHLLGRVARRISADWEAVYAHPIHYLETFIDPTLFRGTCYRAANWLWLGRTTGRGHADSTGRPNRPPKEVLGYPLGKRFRSALGVAR